MKRRIALAALPLLAAAPAFAQSDGEQATVFPLTAAQPPARIFADPPLPDALAAGRVFIPYRVTNLRILPVFGPKALEVTPRIGHLHVTVDGAPWHWADASGTPIILVGLPAGPHKVELVLADANHRPLDRVEVAFTVPAGADLH